jgi:ribosomal protein L11 methyltransferase
MNYISIHVKVDPDYSDILVAELSELGFDTFQDTDEGFEGFAEAEQFDRTATELLLARYAKDTNLSYSFGTVEKKNWNEEWEKSFSPVIIGNQCIVRASFHEPARKYTHEIIINPKMSFGTGHHATTALMLERQLTIDHTNKRVMDVGSGTGILAIMAEKLGAKEVFAFDIEDWAVENAKENTALNGCNAIEVALGDISLAEGRTPYDIVLANINRNILLEQIPAYQRFLAPGGYMLLSGFYDSDAEDIRLCAKDVGMNLRKMTLQDQWACIVLQLTGKH